MTERAALLVTTSEYEDPGLSNLRSTGVDGEALTRVLADPRIGAYDVHRVENKAYHEVGEQVGAFLANRSPSDTLLVYISGHGLKNEESELHFAASNTRLEQLDDTAVAAARLSRQIERCRARRIVLLLDCCYAGAFPAGATPKAGGRVDLSELKGDGRVVLTASSSIEYAFEGRVIAEEDPKPSIFTEAIRLGLANGDADIDRDGVVSASDLFSYVSDSMRDASPAQTPVMHASGLRGTLEVARNPFFDEPNEARAPLSVTSTKDAGEAESPAEPSVSVMPLSEAMEGFLDQIEAIGTDNGRKVDFDFVPTGLEELDDLTGGYRAGELVLLTGESGVGKSTLALNSLRAASIRSGQTALLLTLETGKQEAITRIMSAEGRIPIHHIQHAWMSDQDWQRMAQKMGEVSSAPLFIVDQRPDSLKSLSLTLSRRHNLALVVIDSLQLISDSSDASSLVSATRALKLMAKELNIAVLATVMQEPELDTLSGPIGAIDRYADIVIHVEREDLHDLLSLRPGEADVRVLRNRRGPGKTIVVAFQGHYARFVDIAMYQPNEGVERPSTAEPRGQS